MKRFVLIGAGRIADRHVNAIRNCNGNLLGVFDIDNNKLEDFCMNHSLDAFSSVEEIIDNKPDYIVICSDSGSHFELGMKFIEISDLIIEKPLCVSLKDAETLVELAEKLDRQILVAHQNRFNDSVIWAYDRLSQVTENNIFLANVTLRWCRDNEYYKQADWRGKYLSDGSVLSNQAIHHLDLLLMFLGPHQSVFSYGATIGSQIEAEDTIVATIKFTSGSFATVEASTAIRPHNVEASLGLCWGEGALKIGGTAANNVEYYFDGASSIEAESGLEEGNLVDVYGSGHAMMYSHIIDGVKSDFLTTGRQALDALRLINDIHCSLEQRREIHRNEALYSDRLGRK